MSADELEEVDIGLDDRPRPTFVSAKLDPEYKQELIKLLKEYRDCVAWEYYEMPCLNQDIGRLNKLRGGLSQICMK